MSGTSMAAPVAAGAAALLLSRDPSLTPGDVKTRLMKTATKVWLADGSTPDIFSRGAGLLNIAAGTWQRRRAESAAAYEGETSRRLVTCVVT